LKGRDALQRESGKEALKRGSEALKRERRERLILERKKEGE